ncbi:MAG: type II glyceraldehyde-3-phosphate dehydrogenase [archaeon]|nr:type II glyceraldehyde-3-phosphate dehydrogenase [archaeon]MCP8314633.1 type II glyceraldehyde-3-phosphate dehydrogenase [archaeon]MCP8320445.1 type II glyceraldehyde-3-phosphate dehydrogenase [archaeon]
MIKIGVNGYGVIGRRVADAIVLQPDMVLAGVVKVKADYKARIAVEKKYNLYASDEKSLKSFSESGLSPKGTLKDLLKEVDIIVDACPEGVGAQNNQIYQKFDRKAIFEGGEEHELTGLSFVAQCNFDDAKGRKSLRVVSCNTTALCRVLNSLDKAFKIKRARAVITRRAADPDEISKGPIDAVVLDPVNLPSHHGQDVRTVLPRIDIVTMALKVPTTHMHLHSLIVSVKEKASEDKVRDVLRGTTRILLINSKDGIKSTAQVTDFAREIGRSRSDLYEVPIWEDSIKVIDDEIYFYMGVHQEAIVIPENIDAIRALMGGYSKEESIKLTNKMLGIM